MAPRLCNADGFGFRERIARAVSVLIADVISVRCEKSPTYGI